MKHLKKITISNARRFAPNVEIELSTGANIFLAPNGTGKTTIFESIEFALSGSVKRLNSLKSFLRDNMDHASVRLDFDNDKFCSANLGKDAEVTFTGDHQFLFPNHTKEEIPNLLRLTHLVEQRANDWFVQAADSTKAGELLDILAIGKQLSSIAKTKTTTLSAATKSITEIQAQINVKNDQITLIQNRVTERDAAKLDQELRPLQELAEILAGFQQSTKKDTQANAPDQLSLEANALILSMQNLSARLAQSLLNLSELEAKVPLFQKNQTELELHDRLLILANEKLTRTKIEQDGLKSEASKIQQDLTDLVAKRNAQQNIKSLFGRLDAEQAKLLTNEKFLKEQNSQLEIFNQLLSNLSIQETTYAELLNQYRQISDKEVALNQRMAVLRSFLDLQNQWVNAEKDVLSLQNQNQILDADIQKLSQDLEQQTIGFKTLENDFNLSNGRLQSLKTASEEILKAVGIIAVNLPADQETCPVCDTKFDPAVLKERIASALKHIDPLLTEEISKNQSLNNSLAANREILNTTTRLITSKNEEKTSSQEKLTTTLNYIDTNYKPAFNNSKDAGVALKWLNHSLKELNDELQQNSASKSKFNEVPDDNVLKNIRADKNNTTVAIQSAQSNISNLTSLIQGSQKEIDKIKSEIGSNAPAEVDITLLGLDKELSDVELKRAANNQSANQLISEISQIETEIQSINLIITSLKAQQNSIRSEWKENDIDGDIDVININSKRQNISGQQIMLEEDAKAVSNVQNELTRWQALQKFDLLDRQLKSLTEGQEPGHYIKKLSLEVAQQEEVVRYLNERHAALRELYNAVNKEMATVHEKIKAVNPLWVSLLKKVVVNPRFMETTLESYTYYNKPHAEINTKLHNAPVKVMDVASEAQATDLQLTFMLSMASRYKWTNWKTLLLDDPTQHHDLVHASGVFDLLRDYIVDQDFQVLLGTHDMVQGRFFQRKLQNENIPVKFWRLISTEEGVTAQLME